jgi:prophage antirepressor-like protein
MNNQNELQVFISDKFGQLRTLNVNGKIYFCLSDVCEMLDLENSRQVKTRIDNDYPHVITNDVGVQTGIKADGTPAMQNVSMTFIDEANMYRLIFQSKKPEAKQIQDWVFNDVMPTLMRHGVYAMDKILDDPDLLINALQELKAERAKAKALGETVNIQTQQIAELQPKASYYDLILSCKDAVAVTTIAKDYGKSGKWLNDLLHELGVQYRQSDMWLLYQKHAENGYTCTRTHNYANSDGEQHSRVHTYWTQKGRLFIYDLLKNKKNLLPLIERTQLQEAC